MIFPTSWRRVIGIDHGSGAHHATAVELATITGASIQVGGIKVPQDSLIIYDEHYCIGKPVSCHAEWIQRTAGHWLDQGMCIVGIDKSAPIQEYFISGIPVTPAASSMPKGKLAGLNHVNELFQIGRLFIMETCAELLEEIRGYRYREPTGSEKPDRKQEQEVLKKRDHCCLTGETLVCVDGQWVEIGTMASKRGQVDTGYGWSIFWWMDIGKRQVVELRFDDGFEVRCTLDHRFLGEHGWVDAQQMEVGDVFPILSSCSSLPHETGVHGSGLLSVRKILPGQRGKASCFGMETASGEGSQGVSCASPGQQPLEQRHLESELYHRKRASKHAATGISAPGRSCTLGKDSTPCGGLAQEQGWQGSPSLDRRNGIREGRVEDIQLQVVRKRIQEQNHDSGPSSILRTELQDGKPETHDSTRVLVQKRRVAAERVYCLTVPRYRSFLLRNGILSHNCDAVRYMTDMAYDLLPHVPVDDPDAAKSLPRGEWPNGYQVIADRMDAHAKWAMNNPVNHPVNPEDDCMPVEISQYDVEEEW